MRLVICGSAAAEGIPAIFCECETCAKARERGGKDIRMRTSYNLGGGTHVDFGPDILAQDLKFNLRLENLEHLFFTHSHEDHLQTYEFSMRMPGFSKTGKILSVYGNEQVIERIRGQADFELESGKVRPVKLVRNKRVDLDDVGLAFTPLEATHCPGEEAFIFSVRRENSKVLIANDTGWFADSVWDFLRNNRHDIFIIDTTYCKIDHRAGHLGAKDVVDTMLELKKIGAADSGTVFVANHFSHNGGMLHQDLEEFFAPHSILVGFDGMTLDF